MCCVAVDVECTVCLVPLSHTHTHAHYLKHKHKHKHCESIAIRLVSNQIASQYAV